MCSQLTDEFPGLTPSALRWRCRRGMLELDLLLEQFVKTSLKHLQDNEMQALDRLLDYPDQVMLELLMLQSSSADKEINQLVTKIRNATQAADKTVTNN